MNNAASNRNRNIGAHVQNVQDLLKIKIMWDSMCLASWQNTTILGAVLVAIFSEDSAYAHRERNTRNEKI